MLLLFMIFKFSQSVLHAKREELTDLLMVFLKEKHNREEMLKERLVSQH